MGAPPTYIAAQSNRKRRKKEKKEKKTRKLKKKNLTPKRTTVPTPSVKETVYLRAHGPQCGPVLSLDPPPASFIPGLAYLSPTEEAVAR
jgi:hypothetical protein